MSEQSIEAGLKRLDINVNIDYEKFEMFKTLLIEYNKKTDLTNITDSEEIDNKHFLDSLTLFKIREFSEEKTIVDVGTGAGFPGIPLKLANDKLDVTLMDSLGKRLIFLDEVIKEMNLENTRTIHMRSEEAGNSKDYREKFDIAVSRAVARLNKLVELTMPLVKVGGIFVAMKGKDMDGELEEAKRGIEILGGKIRDVEKFNLFDGENERTLIVIEKIKKTDLKYPRNFGKIKKKPL